MRVRGGTVATLLVLAAPLAAQSDVAFPADVHEARRARLFEAGGGAPVIVAGEEMIRHGGLERQDPNFWYLTGVESPYALLVLTPVPGGGRREVLFVPDSFQFAGAQYPHPDPRFRRAPWNRPIRRLAPGSGSAAAVGVDEVRPLGAFAEGAAGLVGGSEEVWFTSPRGAAYLPPGLGEAPPSDGGMRRGVARLLPGARLRDAGPLVEGLRRIKDRHEIDALRNAARVSVEGMKELMRAARPGMNDLEAAGIMEYVWKAMGSPRASFAPIVASGPAAVSLYTLRSENYNHTDRVMEAGDLLYVDYGAAEWRMYASDLCRTFPVSGRFTAEQRRLYEVVLEAQDSALARIGPGVEPVEVIRAAARVYRARGFDEREDPTRIGVDRVWGVMPSPTYWLTPEASFTDYSGARGTGVRDLGHHIGLEALDGRDWSGTLEPGMVFTVEPKLYVPEAGIAIMIEDMIVVTEDGHENLSAGLARTVEEIEALMAEEPRWVRPRR